MIKKVVYNENGKLKINSIDPNLDEQIYLDRFPGSIIIEESQLPSQIQYLPAYEVLNSEFSLNMSKAKDIHRTLIRYQRIPLLEETDKLYIQALSMNKDATVIKERQAYLRDLTSSQEIENATTLDELNSIQISDWESPNVNLLPDLQSV